METTKKPCDPMERINRALNSIYFGNEVTVRISYEDSIQNRAADQKGQLLLDRLERAYCTRRNASRSRPASLARELDALLRRDAAARK